MQSRVIQVNQINLFFKVLVVGAMLWWLALLPAFGQGKPTGSYYTLELPPGTARSAVISEGWELVRRVTPRQWIVRGVSGKAQSRMGMLTPLEGHMWKLGDAMRRQSALAGSGVATFSMQVRDWDGFMAAVSQLNGVAVLRQHQASGVVHVRCTPQAAYEQLLPLDQVTYLNRENLTPEMEARVIDMNLNPNKVNVVQQRYPSLTGSGMAVSVQELQFDTTDIDLLGRFLKTGVESDIVFSHATDMATVIGGAGNSSVLGAGVAPRVSLASANAIGLLPQEPEAYSTYATFVQNHSYGTDSIDNSYYSANARAFDATVEAVPELLHVISVGNRGLDPSPLGTYSNLPGYGNLTGHFKQAKNLLTVGAVNQTGVPVEATSHGPGYDGQVRPHLLAHAQLGSSGAAAMVSGIAVLLQQAYAEENGGAIPPAALTRALLINSAQDVGPAHVDYTSGWGAVQASRAIAEAKAGHFVGGQVRQGDSLAFTLELPANAINLKLTLVWTDPAAEANAATSLVNDLDLSLHHAGGSWLPWGLDSTPSFQAITAPATRKPDRVNTVEQLTLDAPNPGTYTVVVKGHDVPQGPQAYYVAYQWDVANSFAWTFPLEQDHFPFNGEFQSYFRWESTYAEDTEGQLEMSLDGGNTWNTLGANVNLAAETYPYLPEWGLFSKALARMVLADTVYVTDTFTISFEQRLRVAFTCDDSTGVYWEPLPGAASYALYTLGDVGLELVTETTATEIVLDNSQMTNFRLAMEPRFAGGKPARRSPLYNMRQQGVGCYIINLLLTELGDAGIEVGLSLGTNAGIETMVVERVSQDSLWEAIGTVQVTDTEPVFVDDAPYQGQNFYRARLQFANGAELISDFGSAFFVKDPPLIYFPNPVSREEFLNLYTAELNGEPKLLRIIDRIGQPQLTVQLEFERDGIILKKLTPGYYIMLLETTEEVYTQYLLVY